MSNLTSSPKQVLDRFLQRKAVSQQAKKYRENWPAWMKQLPYVQLPEPNPAFDLINDDQFNALISGAPQHIVDRLTADRKTLQEELMPFFRQCDSRAAVYQNVYRQTQISYIALATLATIFGSLQAVSLPLNPYAVAALAFGETLIALVATFIATISGNEPPYQVWLENRRKAETLRREYFRFLMNLTPYDRVGGHQRDSLLDRRAAEINMGRIPTEDQPGS
jgi:hypothetical protein